MNILYESVSFIFIRFIILNIYNITNYDSNNKGRHIISVGNDRMRNKIILYFINKYLELRNGLR